MKRGHPLYIALLASLRDPQTIQGLMRKHKVSPCMAYPFVVKMHKAGRLHICGWQQLPGKRPLALYAFGRGVDAPMPTKAPSGQKSRVKLLPSSTGANAHLTAFEYLLREIEAGPCTPKEVAEASGIDLETARETLRLLEAHSLAHIKAWHRPYKGSPVPAYAFGPGKRAPRPKPIPKSVIQAKYAAKRRKVLPFTLMRSAIEPLREAA